MKAYFNIMIVGDFFSYNPTFLRITRIALYMYAPIDDVHLKFITFVEKRADFLLGRDSL